MRRSSCAWACISSYYRSDETCIACTTSLCPVGFYRAECTTHADGNCNPCSRRLPEHAIFSTPGMPYNTDNCLWQCSPGFYLGNSSECLACLLPAWCGLGEYIQPCTSNTNFACARCPRIFAAVFTGHGNCNFECESGYFEDHGSCHACTGGILCESNQTYLGCSKHHDATCTFCKPGLEYMSEAPDVLRLNVARCQLCSTTPCLAPGTYQSDCGPSADSDCILCSNGPMHSHYISAGESQKNNCSWQCNAGFEQKLLVDSKLFICAPCEAGTYSLNGDYTCTSCKAGTYSALTGSSSESTCLPCEQGTFSVQVGATTSRVCAECALGMYQDGHGKSSCHACPKDTYGISYGATSLEECLQCRSYDTSTRGAVGQKGETSCICNTNFYRIYNSTIQCQKCPPGLMCNGRDSVIKVVNDSTWVVISLGLNDFYRLTFCPLGYYYAELNSHLLSDPNSYSVLAAQQCVACDAGTECVEPPCLTCSMCIPGHYKSCPGPTNCLPCPQNTFELSKGSLACQQCGKGTTTKGLTGCFDHGQCVCDSQNYDLAKDPSEGCQLCPAGLVCFGNATVVPVALEAGESQWRVTVDVDQRSKFNLTYCPKGHYIAGSISRPAQLQCVQCSAGFECTDPPCYGACTMCRPGYYKGSTLAYPVPVPRAWYDNLTDSYVRRWVDEPCAPCPMNTYRHLEGGTEVGSCTTCPPKSTTRGLLNRTAASDCMCESFYYQQILSSSQDRVCTDCPQGAVCASDRACALNPIGLDTYNVGNGQIGLSCNDPTDFVYGTWKRSALGEFRLEECPPGFTLQRSELSSAADKCVPCPINSYLLEAVASPYIHCKPCPIGAICPGGSAVFAAEGYWQALARRRGSSLVAVVYQCPLGVCGPNNTCKNNRTGAVSACFKIANYMRTNPYQTKYFFSPLTGMWTLSLGLGVYLYRMQCLP
jgi:hypothetical protein